MTLARALRLRRGGEAELCSLSGDRLGVLSTVPSAPGSTLEGELPLAPGLAVQLKVRSCKLQPDGRFAIEGRAVNLTRALRAALEAGLAG